MAKELHFRSLVLVFLLLFQLPCAVYGKSEGKKEPVREKLYLEASLSNRKPFVGQEVLLTYTLYFTDIAPKISDVGKPEHKGLWVQEITPEGYINSATVNVNGVSYRRAVVKQMKLVPMQSGILTVTNYRLRCLTPMSHEISLNNQKDSEQLIAGPDASIDARPLPEPVPEHFSGAVGKFTLQVAPEKNTLHVGEPLVLNISINGKGNLKTFPPIVITLPKEFRQDKPNVATVLQEKSGSSADAISTTIVAVASQPGSFRFSPVNLIYFDPDKKSYETISSPQIPVTVLPGSPGSQANDVAAAEPPAESAKQADTSNLWTIAIIAVVVIAIGSAIVMLRKKQE